MCILHSLIRAMRTGSAVNAAAVENTIPPNMTVANRGSLLRLMPWEGRSRAHIAQRGRHLEISLEFLESMRFERCRATCELQRLRRQPWTPVRLPTQKQSRKYCRAPLSVHVKRCSATRPPLR
jgi:hypothetical protein